MPCPPLRQMRAMINNGISYQQNPNTKGIIIGSTAPEDTTAFWLDTSEYTNGVLKWYVSGSWEPVVAVWS